jgi:hypothetical protein
VAKASTIARRQGLTNLDGGQRSRQGATDDTTTNHQQERQRHSDVGTGCSNSDGGGKGAAATFVDSGCRQQRWRWDGANGANGGIIDGSGS